jgi:hypothetical protein
MSKQAEAERERRARVIAADGEFQASQRLTDAAATMADTPGALQLRLLQTVVDVAAEKNSTLVMPFPVELLRFFERQGGESRDASAQRPVSVPGIPESVAAALPDMLVAPPAGGTTAVNGDDRTARAQAAKERRDNWPTPRQAPGKTPARPEAPTRS